MKIAISSQGKEKESLIDLRFGRCTYFQIYDTDTEKLTAIENSAISSTGGAGIQAANLLLNENVDAVVTGILGPNAVQVLKASDVKIFTSGIKKISDIISDYKENKLEVKEY